MDLLESSYKPNLFIRSRKKNACPRPNAVDGSLIYKGDAEAPMLNQQDNSYTRFPHGTEVRFDCLRTEIEDNLEDESVIDEYDEDIIDEGDDIINTEEEDFIDEYDDTEIGDEYYEDDDEILNFRKKRAIKQRTKSRKKSNSKKNSSRRRNQNVNQEGNNNQGTEYNNQVHGGQGESVEDMLKKVKYRSWKIDCNDGSWIGKSLGCDENGNPLLDDENITKFQNFPPKSDHFTPKLMSFL